MKPYPKIVNLFQRDPATHKVTKELRRPEFHVIRRWWVTEKVDGMNMRIGRLRDEGEPEVAGRTDRADLPPELRRACEGIAYGAALHNVMEEHDLSSITLYGEGYGPGIQKGGGDYRDDKGFILFDAWVNGRSWLDDDQITELAIDLHIQRVPVISVAATLDDIVEYVAASPPSRCAVREHVAEGVVARPRTPLFDRYGNRVMFKAKVRDLA